MDMYQTSMSIRHCHISGINSEHVGKTYKIQLAVKDPGSSNRDLVVLPTPS